VELPLSHPYVIAVFSPFMTAAGLNPHRYVVAFRLETDVLYIAKSPLELNRRPPKNGLKMAKRIYEKYDGSQVTDSMLQEASQLFSENYGVWGRMLYALDVPSLKKVNWLKLTPYRSFIRIGNRVRIGKDRVAAAVRLL
jgi:hypothetical protein